MTQSIETRILNAEEQLRLAMLASDVDVLHELLAPDLIFTNHFGHLMSKQDDLAAHRSGMLKIRKLKPSERHIRLHGETVVVSVRMQLEGTYDGNPANGDFRFTRVWAVSPSGAWHVVAAHAGIVA
jgi:ketosteroid isomerase-like protein